MSGTRLLFAGADEYAEIFASAAAKIPGLDLVPWKPGVELAGIRYLMTWRPVPGLAAAMPDLSVVFGFGAGVERLIASPDLPAHLPIVRMVDPGLTGGMVQYVLWQVLRHHRRIWELEEAQAASAWRPHVYPAAWDRKVGILGTGVLGTAAASALVGLDFAVRGWSRTAKSLPGVVGFAGDDGLAPFLSGLDILVCLLPLTPATAGILNGAAFARLAHGASVINAGRGGHLVEPDLILALESGQLAAASLDVFQKEPLPPGHPFWSHPRIFMTPHNASDTGPASGLAEILAQIRRFEAGLPLEHAVDRQRGY